MEQEIPVNNRKDFTWSWARSSRFLFYVMVFSMISFFVGISFGLYAHRYKGKPKVVVPENTLYTPKYK